VRERVPQHDGTHLLQTSDKKALQASIARLCIHAFRRGGPFLVNRFRAGRLHALSPFRNRRRVRILGLVGIDPGILRLWNWDLDDGPPLQGIDVVVLGVSTIRESLFGRGVVSDLQLFERRLEQPLIVP